MTAWRLDLVFPVYPHRSIRVDTYGVCGSDWGGRSVSRFPLLGVPVVMTCVGRCKFSDDRCDVLGDSGERSTLLGVPELVRNYHMDESARLVWPF